MKGVVISVMVVLVMVQFMVKPGEAMTCGQVDASLAPCVPYLTNGGNPTTACCNGVKSIKGMTTTPVDKRAACNCVKEAANRYSNLKDDAAQALPAKCNVQMDIPVDKRAACNCVKEAANRYSNLKDDAAQALPAKCNVQMDIPISRSTNCDVIN